MHFALARPAAAFCPSHRQSSSLPASSPTAHLPVPKARAEADHHGFEPIAQLAHRSLTLQSPNHANIPLRRFLTKHLGLPISLIHRLIRSRKLTLQEDSSAPETVPDLALRLDVGNILHIRDPSVVIREAWESSSIADEESKARQPSQHVPKSARDKIRSWVVYEDDLVVVVNKPSGVAVHGGTGNTTAWSTLTDLAHALSSPSDPHPPLLVHRIDKSTSGLVLLAKTRYAADLLSAHLRTRTLAKTYLAVTAGVPTPRTGRVQAQLYQARVPAVDPNRPPARVTQYGTTPADTRDMHERTLVATSTSPPPLTAGGDQVKVMDSETAYRVLATSATAAGTVAGAANLALVEFKPLTGRKHQLRAVAHQVLKCPIVGDYKYGYRDHGRGRKLHLHLWKVELPWGAGGKQGETTVVTAEVPEHVIETLEVGKVSNKLVVGAPPKAQDWDDTRAADSRAGGKKGSQVPERKRNR